MRKLKGRDFVCNLIPVELEVYYPPSEEPHEVLCGFISVYFRFYEELRMFAQHAETVKHFVWKKHRRTRLSAAISDLWK